MIGWESLDNTVRLVAYQTLNGGNVQSAFRRAPAKAGMACTFNFEKPAATEVFSVWTSGTLRLGV